MHSPLAPSPRPSQCGAVLLLAMVFLLLLTIVASTAVQTGVMEFRMAGNDQFREEAFQRAQAIATEIADHVDNFPVVGGVGYTICKTGDPDPACNTDGNALTHLTTAVAPTGVGLSYKVVRQGPLVVERLPLRVAEDEAAGANVFSAAMFEVVVEVDGNEMRLGNARVVEGIAIRIPARGQ